MCCQGNGASPGPPVYHSRAESSLGKKCSVCHVTLTPCVTLNTSLSWFVHLCIYLCPYVRCVCPYMAMFPQASVSDCDFPGPKHRPCITTPNTISA